MIDRIKQLFNHATADYIRGVPRRLSDPETSVLSTITYEALLAMDSQSLQNMFASKNVIVTGCPHDVNLKFDSDGLRTLTGSMSTQISITGM